MNPAIIVGGGLSGLSAAVALSRRSVPVLLLEQKPFLGGRAYSFADRSTGTDVDNGQHLLIAGYTATLDLLRTLDTLPLVSIQRRPDLMFHHPERGFRRFTLPLWPPPSNLFWGVRATDLFTFREKREIMRAGLSLLRPAQRIPPVWTVSDWLAATGQGEEPRRSFWVPLAVAIMNERPEVSSARLFVRSLQKAFLSSRRGAALVIPSVGLSRLFADPAEAYLLSRGGLVRRSAEVTGFSLDGNTVTGVRMKNGQELPCSAVVLAVPPPQAARLLPPGVLAMEAGTIPESPIVSIHLWFSSPFMREDAVGVIGRTIQWVFRKQDHVSVTISAAHDLHEKSNEELVREAVHDLRQVFGVSVGEPRHFLVIREKRATISCSPAAEPHRPGHRTGLTNLLLAGDWTSTGLPATIEGAVESGNRAAEAVFGLIRSPR